MIKVDRAMVDADKVEALAAIERMTFPQGMTWFFISSRGDSQGGMIRGDMEAGRCCPITAWAVAEGGEYREPAYVGQAGVKLSLSMAVAQDIVDAADLSRDSNPEIRAALLRKCGLTE